jgi:hypothetical protein
MFDWLKSNSPRNHFGLQALSRTAADDPFRLFSPDPQADSGWLSLDSVIDVALRSRAPWLAQRGVAVHFSPGRASIRADEAGVRFLVDELIQWSASRAPEISITAGAAGPGSPNLMVRAKLESLKPGRVRPKDTGQEALVRQLQQLATLTQSAQSAQSAPPTQSLARSFFTRQPDHLCFGVEFAGGAGCGAVVPAHDEGRATLATGSLLAGRRLALLTHNEGLRSSIRSLTRGLGLSVRSFASVAQVRQDAAKFRPHAVIYDSSIDAAAMLSLHAEMTGASAPDFVSVDEDAGKFHLTQRAGLTTFHVASDALGQALMPALAFTLCRR